LADGGLTVGFIGGSITDARPGHNWPDHVVPWLVDQFPEARVCVENAAIGATGSDLAVFRAERDLLAADCDLVFVEFAVNDGGAATERRNRSREGLLRKLLADSDRDVVLAYTFSHIMYDDTVAGRVHPSIAEFEALAEHYQLPSVWMGLHAIDEVARGLMSWDAWLPDGLHPTHLGSRSYAGARATAAFDGQGVAVALDFGKLSADFRWRIDGGDWQPSAWERFDWMGDRGWFRLSVLSDELGPGKHQLELEVVHPGAGLAGTQFALAMIGVTR
jgi:lysophospholipase L1-like esterase